MDFSEWLLTEKKSVKQLIVIRRLPGVQPSLAMELLTKKGGSNDHIFHTAETSVKDGKGLLSGHNSTFQAFKYAIDNGYTPIILDNDHLNWGSMADYVRYADKAEYEIKLEEPGWKEWGKNRQFLKDRNEKQLPKLKDLLHKNGASRQKINSAIKKWQEISLKEKLEKKKKS